ncbi:tape measure protein [Christiangramia crocea]|uniref:Tape measure protein n=1 Tax=Christiangramia crocea TaxID=2904124 RepID=A0A9X1UVT4_9FLAO|nr:tape measure protein [Gramella crocea]MCG9970990.1 tape measure protein [Gramella crocea]
MAKNTFDKSLKEALNTIEQIKNGMIQVDKTILEAAKSAKTLASTPLDKGTPKELNDRLQKSATYRKQVNIQLKEQARLEKALASAQAKFYSAQSSHNKDLQKTRFETNQLNKKYREQAVLSSKLATEYQKQSVVLNQLRRRYKDVALVQGENSKEARKLQREIQQLDGRLKKVDANVGQFQRSVGNYGKAWSKAGSLISSAMAAFGVVSAVDIGRQIFQQVKEIDALNKALAQVTENSENFSQAQGFIKDLAEETGVQINTLQKAYTKFYASAKVTNLTLAETQDIFRQTAKAGAVLGLSTEEVNGAIRALEQILSKGKVQAEEIRGQLGERLPGAFQILAKSMGLTTQELSKQLELGNVISEEVLPGFANELEKTFSLDKIDKVETLAAAQGRLSNSFNQAIRSMEEGNNFISKTLIKTFDSLGEKITDTTEDIQDFGVEVTSSTNYFTGMYESIRKLVRESDLLTGALNNTVNVLYIIKGLLSISIFEFWGELLRGVTTTIKSFTESLGQLKDEVSDFYNTFKSGGIFKAFEELEGWNTRVKDAFAGAWSSAYSDVKINRKKIQEEIDQFVKDNGSLAPLAPGQKLKYFDITNSYEEKEDKNADAIDKTNKKLKERKDIDSISEIREGNLEIKKSIGYFEDLIQVAEKTADSISDPVAWKKLQDQIKEFKKAIEDIKGNGDVFDGIEIEIGDSALNSDAIFAGMENLSGLIGEDMQALMNEFASSYEWDYNEFVKWSQKKIEQADEENKLKKEKLADWMQYAGDVVYEIGSLAMAFSERKIQKYEDEIQKNNEMYENWLENENLTDTERKQLEKERAEREKALQKKIAKEKEKQAKIDKATAAFSIAINTAAAIVEALPNIPLSIAIGALGAIQLATVLAKPIPKYKHGRKGGEAELAEVGDGGKSEVVTDSQGRFKYITPNKPTYTYLDKGDNVISSVPEYLEGLTLDKLNQAAIMTSLQSQAKALNNRQTEQNFNKEILKAIQEGNNKKQTPPPAPNYGRLASEFAKEMNFIRRRDV